MTSVAVLSPNYSQLIAAGEVQQRFMGYNAPPIENLSYSARCRQVGEVGGDCYDFLPLPEDQLAFAIADASGKGLAAALMISNVQSSLRTAALFAGDDASATVAVVNRQVHASALAGRFATLFYGVFDAATRSLHYVNAGHNPPMVIRRDGSILPLETGGVPVGIFPDRKYMEGSVQLHPGDLVVSYTDGVTEALNPAGGEWGVERMRTVAVANQELRAADIVDAIFASMDEFSGRCQTDDATVLVLKKE